MTQETPISTQETMPAENPNPRRMFWATVSLASIFVALSIYLISTLLKLPGAPVVYVGIAVFLLTMTASIAGIVFSYTDRHLLGTKVLFFTINFIGTSVVGLFTARAIPATFTLLIISVALTVWVLPKKLRFRYLAYAAVFLAVLWTFELSSPAWRIPFPAAQLGPGAAVLFVFILVFLSIRQTWQNNNVRTRFLIFLLGLTIISTAIVATISVFSLTSAANQAQETSGAALRDQAQEALIRQVDDIANENALILQGISQDAKDAAQQTAQIFENPNAFNTEALWKADEHMFIGDAGQYVNGENDVSTVFVPNTVRITESLNKKLELLAYIDIALVPIYESSPNTVAIYYVGKEEISWLHPNINLGAIVPPDYQATQDIFYTSGAPENNPDRQVVWTPVYDDPGGQGLLVSTIAPVYANGIFQGVIGVDVSLAGLTAAVEEESGANSGGYSFVLDANGRALALPEQGYLDFYGRERSPNEFGTDFAASAKPEFGPVLTNLLAGETGFQTISVDGQEFFIAYTTIPNTGWRVASVAQANEVLAPATALQAEIQALSNNLITRRLLPVGLGILVLIMLAGVFFTNLLVNPIEQLTEGAAKIGAGEWDTPLPHSDLEEIDNLSNIMSQMATQIKGTLETLEQRVAERTENLELAAEVGRTVSQVNDLDTMLERATNLIQERFDLYYVQIYLADENKTRLLLESGTGDVGKELLARRHNLLINAASINGRAALEKQPVVISDTSQSTTFRKNPLLPDTRSEMAIPLMVGDQVLGVLNMQSAVPNALTEESLPAFEALAGQLAVAVENATLLEQTEQARMEVEALARRQVRQNWNQHLDGIHKHEQIGFSFDHEELKPLDADDPKTPADNGSLIEAPIAWVGEELGSLSVEMDTAVQSEENIELVNIVARQVSQQIENLRLIENAERYLHEAQDATRRQTHEGWQEYLRSRESQQLGYMYDSTKVVPHGGGAEDNCEFFLPLKARNEEVGKLAVEGIDPNDQEALELANEVVARLGDHIESLRLFEQSKTTLSETQSLYRINEAIGSATDLERVYQIVAELSCEELGFTGSWISVYEAESETLRGVAGVNLPEEMIYSNPSLHEVSPATLAAQALESVIVNNPENDERMVGIPSEVRVRMGKALSVPVLLGKELIGVIAATRPENAPDIGVREERMLQATAAQLATVIQRIQLFEQTQKALDTVAESQKELAEALVIAKLANWEYDVEADIFTFNDQFYSLLHTNLEEMGSYQMSSTDYATKFVHPDDAPLVGQEIEKALLSPERFYQTTLEHRIKFWDGGEGYVVVDVSVEKDEDGKVLRFFGANQDITERKTFEATLEKSAEERAEALRIARLANWEYDVEADLFTFNDQFYDLLHTNAEEMGGYQVQSAVYAQKFVHPDDAYLVGTEIQKSLESPERHYQANLEHRVRYADGGEGYFSVRVTVEKDENGKVLQYVGANQDITERKRNEIAVQKRAAELATVAAISTQVTTMHETEEILQSVVDLSKENFKLYHAHIYMMDDAKENLVLAAGAGEAGEKMVAEGWQIPLSQEQSLVARTAREKAGFIVNDVRQEEGFMANPLLPDTAAELAVPLVIENEVLGVLDVQSDEVDYFSDEDLNIQTTLAAQIAVAIQNARSFKTTQEQARYEAKINLISQRIQGTTNVEEALQVAVRELGRALGAKQASIQLDVADQDGS